MRPFNAVTNEKNQHSQGGRTSVAAKARHHKGGCFKAANDLTGYDLIPLARGGALEDACNFLAHVPGGKYEEECIFLLGLKPPSRPPEGSTEVAAQERRHWSQGS